MSRVKVRWRRGATPGPAGPQSAKHGPAGFRRGRRGVRKAMRARRGEPGRDRTRTRPDSGRSSFSPVYVRVNAPRLQAFVTVMAPSRSVMGGQCRNAASLRGGRPEPASGLRHGCHGCGTDVTAAARMSRLRHGCHGCGMSGGRRIYIPGPCPGPGHARHGLLR